MVLGEFEDRVNRRPLTFDSDRDPLNPAHFLFGTSPSSSFASSSVPHSTVIPPSSPDALSRLHGHRQVISAHLWKRWKTEYLSSLRHWRKPPRERLQRLRWRPRLDRSARRSSDTETPVAPRPSD